MLSYVRQDARFHQKRVKTLITAPALPTECFNYTDSVSLTNASIRIPQRLRRLGIVAC